MLDQIFYRCSIALLLLASGHLAVFVGGGNLTKEDKSRLEKIMKKGGGIVGRKRDSFDTLYEKRVEKTNHKKHPPTPERHTARRHDPTQTHTNPHKAQFNGQLNIHCCRYMALKVRASRNRNSFVPTTFRVFNKGGRGQARLRMIEREGEREGENG